MRAPLKSGGLGQLPPEILARKLSNLLSEGQINEVFEVTANYTEADLSQKRIMLHFIGLAHVYSGHLNKAKLNLLTAIKEGGENIGLIRDLACVYYQLGEIDLWRHTYKQLQQTLHEQDQMLSLESKVSSSLILAKFLEEEGQVAQALETFENCLAQSRTHKYSSEIYLQCLCQVVRLKSQFKSGPNLGALYSELISQRPQNLSVDLKTEWQHALMLAEISLIGVGHAWARVIDILESPMVACADRRLIFFDFVEELLVRGLALPTGLENHIPNMEGADLFEREVYRLAFEPQAKRSIAELSGLAAELSWAGYLRLLILYMAVEQNANKSDELQNKIQLILGAVSLESRPFWLNRMRPFLPNKELKLEYSPRHRILIYKGKRIDLSRKRGMMIVLESLATQSRWSVESMIERVWATDYSPEHYHRLRMTVHRLNQLIFEITAYQKSIEINSDTVCLTPSVNLSLNDQDLPPPNPLSGVSSILLGEI